MSTGSVSAPSAPAGEIARRLVGAWRYVGTWIDGKPKPIGAHPKGMICYTETGHMLVHVAPDRDRSKAGAEPTPDEAKAALADYIGYFGTYAIDERAGTVTHHRWASVQPGDEAPLVRAYEFSGDRLILRPLGTRNEVVWERIG